jgi:outer membrane lipoprotein-sorting protein
MKRVLLISLIILSHLTAFAQDNANSRQAKRVFNTAWNHIYGKEGVRFHYKIDILHLYKEEGTSWNKGDKAKSEYKDSKMWNDGNTKYILREKKGIVEIHDPKVNKKDNKLQMFKFEPDSYNYSIAKDPEGLLVTLDAKPGAKVKMKKIIALLNSGNYYPKKLRIKVSIFWATITFSNFQAGNIDDSIFIFPKEKYSNYKIIDER